MAASPLLWAEYTWDITIFIAVPPHGLTSQTGSGTIEAGRLRAAGGPARTHGLSGSMSGHPVVRWANEVGALPKIPAITLCGEIAAARARACAATVPMTRQPLTTVREAASNISSGRLDYGGR